VRARKQIVKLYDSAEEESDPQTLDRLASAIYRMSEVERVLSGRPLPRLAAPDS
jgi:hypothetical protein